MGALPILHQRPGVAIPSHFILLTLQGPLRSSLFLRPCGRARPTSRSLPPTARLRRSKPSGCSITLPDISKTLLVLMGSSQGTLIEMKVTGY